MQRLTLSLAFVAVATLTTSAVVAQQPDDIVQTAQKAGNFKTLVAAVQAAGLVDTLQGRGPFTVFAPTDEAFSKLPAGTLENLLKPENKDALTAILTYHVVPARVTAKDAFSASSAPTVNGQRLDVRFADRQLNIDQAKVVQADINCRNGVIHVIDAVLLPSQQTIPEIAEGAGSFGTLLAAVKAAGLAETLSSSGPFTVFAPTDEAFAKLPAGTVENLLKPENRNQLVDILKYHVVSGRVYLDQAIDAGKGKTLQGQSVQFSVQADGPRVNESVLLKTDLEASNGVIHVIDSVLIPQQMSARQAIEALDQAVHTGASLYNRGHASRCVKVYETVCRELIEGAGPEMPTQAVSALRVSMDRASRMHHMGQRAWTLRHGIDTAYMSLSESRQMSQSVQRGR